MKKSIHVFLAFVVRLSFGAQEIDVLSELPLGELLVQKKIVEDGLPAASPVVGSPPPGVVGFEGFRRVPHRKTFYDEDHEDEKGHVHKKKDEHKINDLLNTSIMVLSYLAFGGYLLCMITTALREKRRRVAMAYPTAPAAQVSNQFAHVLQHHMTHRPARPFVRFPAVTVHQGRKKRRRRSTQKEAPRGRDNRSPPLFNVIDYIEILALGGD